MTDFFFKSVSSDDSAITAVLGDKKHPEIDRRVIIGIDQFDMIISPPPLLKAVSPTARLPKPSCDEYRHKICPTCKKEFYDDSVWGNKAYCKPECRKSLAPKVVRDKICLGCHSKFHDDSRHNNMQYCKRSCRPKRVRKTIDIQPGEKAKSKPKKNSGMKPSKPKKQRSKKYPKCLWCGAKNPNPAKPYCRKSHEDQANQYKIHTGES